MFRCLNEQDELLFWLINEQEKDVGLGDVLFFYPHLEYLFVYNKNEEGIHVKPGEFERVDFVDVCAVTVVD
ncbi:hypothetical protein [Bacillus sp. UNC41MFS5]|uniref:hypothetical protein n=1 Tax=Bacillus sp. UNC41MFS5 TaxID=1449046 RepID=UPI0012DE6C2C|nr:hypothetical protein [Bacillus sp. UNC41MFS5]